MRVRNILKQVKLFTSPFINNKKQNKHSRIATGTKQVGVSVLPKDRLPGMEWESNCHISSYWTNQLYFLNHCDPQLHWHHTSKS